MAAAGIQVPSFVELGIAPTLVTTSGAATFAMAFGLFGRRRRDGEAPAPDEILAEQAMTGVGTAGVEAALLVAAGDAFVTGTTADVDLEALMPRWRRPSLMHARKADPVRSFTPLPRLTFDVGLTGPLAGHERRLIRYRVVRLLDSPDELRGIDIGYLDEGDEVELLERHGAYWRVTTPDGQQGWLHKMTLGDTVGQDADSGPSATMPLAADSWTMADADDGNSVLEAYLAARRREE
jgi:hypothetical protein